MPPSKSSENSAAKPRDGALPRVYPGESEEQQGDEVHDIPSIDRHSLTVVGLGGSADSISALSRFFESTPAQTGMAYVVILHLAPDHHSTLPQLLQHHSTMPVQVATDAVRLEADNVYVIPPGKHLTAVDGQLRLTDLHPEHGKRAAVDVFFRSLADAQGPRAAAIVLSGANGDGAIGLKRIKERGGLTIAQDPGEAEHPSMPRSAIATGMVDWILRVSEMPQRIVAYRSREARLKLPSEEGSPAQAEAGAEVQSVNEELSTLNAEFKNRVEQLSRANSDLHNLMSATQIATIFLDLELKVMRYTPAAAPLFTLITGDIGQPISHLKQRVEYPELSIDSEQVLRTLVPVEREVRSDGRWFLARVLPYRTLEDYIAGVVLTFIDITDRKSFESALRATEQRLQTLADAVPHIIWTNDREGKAVYFNQRWYEYSGCSTEESVGPGWQAIVHPDDTARAVDQRQRALMAGEVFECECRLRRADGVYRWFLGRNVPTFDAEGRTDGWVGSATDIEDLKSAEGSLRASEEQFRRAIEDAPIPLIIQSEDGQVLQISKAWTALTGFTPEEVPTFDAWLNRADAPGSHAVRALTHDLFRGKVNVLNADLDVITRNGDVRHWVFSASAPGVLIDGRRFIVGMVSDITERRHAEEQLRESQSRLRLIVENARDYAIFSLDLERRITSWNSGAQEILGYTQKEAVGQSADIIFTPDDRAGGIPQLEARTAIAEGRATDERWHLRKDGSRLWGSGVMMAMRDGPGAALGLVKIFRDQTAELHAKEAVEKTRGQLRAALRDTEAARDQAEAAGKAKDRFLAVLSHELRAPLTPVLLGAKLLTLNKALPPSARETIAIIERNARLQTHMIDDLLDVSRITHGKLELSAKKMDLHVAVERAVEVAHPDIGAKRQRLSVALEAADHMVWGDAGRLQQVFGNLLKNASKFTPLDGQIVMRSRNEGERVVVEVRDTGVGFAPEAAERIFAVFEQGSREVTIQYGGLGLGLAVAEASVKAHGGSIRAASDGPGTGATFILDLPVIRPE